MGTKKKYRVYKKGGESFNPHMMYNPRTNEGYLANTYDEHSRMNDMGYGHESMMRNGGTPCFECGGTTRFEFGGSSVAPQNVNTNDMGLARIDLMKNHLAENMVKNILQKRDELVAQMSQQMYQLGGGFNYDDRLQANPNRAFGAMAAKNYYGTQNQAMESGKNFWNSVQNFAQNYQTPRQYEAPMEKVQSKTVDLSGAYAPTQPELAVPQGGYKGVADYMQKGGRSNGGYDAFTEGIYDLVEQYPEQFMGIGESLGTYQSLPNGEQVLQNYFNSVGPRGTYTKLKHDANMRNKNYLDHPTTIKNAYYNVKSKFQKGGSSKPPRSNKKINKALYDNYEAMLNNRPNDQYDNLFYDANVPHNDVLEYMVKSTGLNGVYNDPGTYANNINKLMGKAVIPFPVNPATIVTRNPQFDDVDPAYLPSYDRVDWNTLNAIQPKPVSEENIIQWKSGGSYLPMAQDGYNVYKAQQNYTDEQARLAQAANANQTNIPLPNVTRPNTARPNSTKPNNKSNIFYDIYKNPGILDQWAGLENSTPKPVPGTSNIVNQDAERARLERARNAMKEATRRTQPVSGGRGTRGVVSNINKGKDAYDEFEKLKKFMNFSTNTKTAADVAEEAKQTKPKQESKKEEKQESKQESKVVNNEEVKEVITGNTDETSEGPSTTNTNTTTTSGNTQTTGSGYYGYPGGRFKIKGRVREWDPITGKKIKDNPIKYKSWTDAGPQNIFGSRGPRVIKNVYNQKYYTNPNAEPSAFQRLYNQNYYTNPESTMITDNYDPVAEQADYNNMMNDYYNNYMIEQSWQPGDIQQPGSFRSRSEEGPAVTADQIDWRYKGMQDDGVGPSRKDVREARRRDRITNREKRQMNELLDRANIDFPETDFPQYQIGGQRSFNLNNYQPGQFTQGFGQQEGGFGQGMNQGFDPRAGGYELPEVGSPYREVDLKTKWKQNSLGQGWSMLGPGLAFLGDALNARQVENPDWAYTASATQPNIMSNDGDKGSWTANPGFFRPNDNTPVQFGKYGGNMNNYQTGGEYELNDDEIQAILRAGGKVEFI